MDFIIKTKNLATQFNLGYIMKHTITKITTSAFLVLFLFGFSNASKADVDKGIMAFNSKKFQESYQILLPLAEEGELKAQHYVGLMYLYGLGVRKNIEEAYVWLETATSQNYGPAQYSYGYSEFERQSNFYFATKAKMAYGQSNMMRAIEEGNDVGENAFWLAMSYWREKLNDKRAQRVNEKRAFILLKQAAKHGHAKAHHILGIFYERGTGIPQDANEAQKWYRKAKAKGVAIE